MRSRLTLGVATAVLALAGCSDAGGATNGATGPVPSPPATTGSAAASNKDCSGGLTGREQGVARISCSGTAEVKLQAGSVARDMHGGECHSAAGVWSVLVGVVVDETGSSGAYTGPAVDYIEANNTNTPGRATVQAVIGGKHYYDLGHASLTLSSDSKTAHIEGSGESSSDAPGVKITVDVTC
jgi:hypothetical protein